MPETNLLLHDGVFLPVFGTCELPQTFGEVISASLARANDIQEIPNCCGGLKALLLRKRRWEMTLKAVFDSTIGLPEEGDPISFPLAGVIGTILNFTIDWTQNDQVQLTINASHWDSLGDNGEVGGMTVTELVCGEPLS